MVVIGEQGAGNMRTAEMAVQGYGGEDEERKGPRRHE